MSRELLHPCWDMSIDVFVDYRLGSRDGPIVLAETLLTEEGIYVANEFRVLALDETNVNEFTLSDPGRIRIVLAPGSVPEPSGVLLIVVGAGLGMAPFRRRRGGVR